MFIKDLIKYLKQFNQHAVIYNNAFNQLVIADGKQLVFFSVDVGIKEERKIYNDADDGVSEFNKNSDK